MAVTIYGSYSSLEAVIELPSPQYDDTVGLEVKLLYYEAMDGTPYSYKQTNNERRIVMEFNNVKKSVLLSLNELLAAYFDEFVKIIDHRDRTWRAKILSPEHSFTVDWIRKQPDTQRHEGGSFTLEFVGEVIE